MSNARDTNFGTTLYHNSLHGDTYLSITTSHIDTTLYHNSLYEDTYLLITTHHVVSCSTKLYQNWCHEPYSTYIEREYIVG